MSLLADHRQITESVEIDEEVFEDSTDDSFDILINSLFKVLHHVVDEVNQVVQIDHRDKEGGVDGSGILKGFEDAGENLDGNFVYVRQI